MSKNLGIIYQDPVKDPEHKGFFSHGLSHSKSSVTPDDTAKLIGCKTSVYLDLYENRDFVPCLIIVIFCCVSSTLAILIMWYHGEALGLFNMATIPFWVLGLHIIYYFLMPPPLPKMRFNRQRQQVYVSLEKGQGRYVNWDEVVPLYLCARRYAKGGASHELLFYIKDSISSFGYKKVFSAQCHGSPYLGNEEKGVVAQWECIRGFMEDKYDACSDSHYNCTYFEQGDNVSATFLNWIKYRKHPTFSDPHIIEWSKSLED